MIYEVILGIFVVFCVVMIWGLSYLFGIGIYNLYYKVRGGYKKWKIK